MSVCMFACAHLSLYFCVHAFMCTDGETEVKVERGEVDSGRDREK